MRFLVVCAALLISQSAHAKDIHIHVDYETSEYRIRPDPGERLSHSSVDVVMHPGGVIEEGVHGSGRYSRDTDTSHQMGDGKYNVVNSNTITRRTKNAVTTITVTGTTCEAQVRVLNGGEYVALSTQLGVKAVYRDLKVLHTSCTIQ